ncbi:hypothetical protein SCHPADRAFT_947571 [Schizopora paradoxa]|uniref:RxLR effector protein n=1 Tax=Schizopora paradoxa TaxID=27342 RepID=A0A0H2R047_9AGAM|nr:hypothetical protein SCHPADRAFT_947571 [Schizopora paradoxa]
MQLRFVSIVSILSCISLVAAGATPDTGALVARDAGADVLKREFEQHGSLDDRAIDNSKKRESEQHGSVDD